MPSHAVRDKTPGDSSLKPRDDPQPYSAANLLRARPGVDCSSSAVWTACAALGPALSVPQQQTARAPAAGVGLRGPPLADRQLAAAARVLCFRQLTRALLLPRGLECVRAPPQTALSVAVSRWPPSACMMRQTGPCTFLKVHDVSPHSDDALECGPFSLFVVHTWDVCIQGEMLLSSRPLEFYLLCCACMYRLRRDLSGL